MLIGTLFTFSTIALAAEGESWISHFALPFSASWGVGTLRNSDAGLPSRVMDRLSLELSPAYHYQEWYFGLHFDYRWQGQITGLESAGGTNLRGQGFLAGLGVKRDFDRFFAQFSFDFLGYYDLTQNTSVDEDDSLRTPLGFRLKGGYAFIESVPNLTFDLDLQYLRFGNIRVEGVDYSQPSQQLIIAVGATYQFGPRQKSKSQGEGY